ncbi:EamA family transporter RarD [Ignatzschineria rhizosphaerae]|uniref:EamA family transporter RarD n=1 Tax=Ignatzschineria rhizosphaerae TaxID=2923279 RepID=A0ABY3WX06_9GAMM|nr:EamA family transporter RarD [Ignatzschineria rhizosphaerae]UNM95143.1 EamA family transporter RarD [Ignatzschineria rhizosphaerae]
MQTFNTADNYKKGVFLTLSCYIIWGFFPIYWYPLAGMDPLQLMAQRIGWALLFIAIVLCFRKDDRTLLKDALTNRRIIITFIGSSAFLFMNWSIYLYAIGSHQVLEASLGYYINPLISIFLGMLIFKEKLTKAQVIAIIIATCGILWLAFLGGRIPYIAIFLAISFGLYGAIKKVASLPPLPGLFLETLFMFPFTIIYLSIMHHQGNLVFSELPPLALVVLLLSGAATTIPLLLFAKGAKYIPLSIVGILQYVSPTLQFLSGLLIFGESFSFERLIGFMIVWASVGIYIGSEIHRIRKKRKIARNQMPSSSL